MRSTIPSSYKERRCPFLLKTEVCTSLISKREKKPLMLEYENSVAFGNHHNPLHTTYYIEGNQLNAHKPVTSVIKLQIKKQLNDFKKRDCILNYCRLCL